MSKIYQVKYESPFTGLFILDTVTKDKEEAEKRKSELQEHYEFIFIEVIEEEE